MTTQEQLAALAWEARRRGIRYGELAARLTPEEEQTIYDRFREARAKVEENARREWAEARKRTAKRKRAERAAKGARPLTVKSGRREVPPDEAT